MPRQLDSDPVIKSGQRIVIAHAVDRPGPLQLRYEAIVDPDHDTVSALQIAEVPVADPPGSVLPDIYRSRHCQSDSMHKLAAKELGHLWQGYSGVQDLRDWVMNRVTFRSNSPTGNTTAVDSPVEKVGVCRDFAHLMMRCAAQRIFRPPRHRHRLRCRAGPGIDRLPC